MRKTLAWQSKPRRGPYVEPVLEKATRKFMVTTGLTCYHSKICMPGATMSRPRRCLHKPYASFLMPSALRLGLRALQSHACWRSAQDASFVGKPSFEGTRLLTSMDEDVPGWPPCNASSKHYGALFFPAILCIALEMELTAQTFWAS
eukprot:1161988-Pelagomonas_calceolata.AAC.8